MIAPATDPNQQLTDHQLELAVADGKLDRYPHFIHDGPVDKSKFLLLSFLNVGAKSFVKIYDVITGSSERACIDRAKQILRTENSACKIHFVHPGCWVPVDQTLAGTKTVRVMDNVEEASSSGGELETIKKALHALQADIDAKRGREEQDIEKRVTQLVEESRSGTQDTLDEYVINKQKLHETCVYIEQYERKIELFRQRRALLEAVLLQTCEHEPNFEGRYKEKCAKHGIAPIAVHRWQVPPKLSLVELYAQLDVVSKEINKAQYIVG